MFCPKCGTQCADTERFCPSCGAALGESSAPESSGSTGSSGSSGKKPLNIPVKPIIIGVVAVIALVVVFNVVKGLFGGGGGGSYASYSKNALFALYNSDDKERVFYVGTKEVGKIEEPSGVYYSRDGSVAFCNDSDKTLYVVTSKGVEKVAGDIKSILYSADGSALIYVDEDYTVYWYDVAKNKSEKLGSGDENAVVSAVAPDGSAACYVTYDGDDYEGFLVQRGKKAESLGKNIVPFAVANKGTYVYYVKVKNAGDSTGTLYVSKGKDEVKLASDFNPSSTSFLFNSDCTQMVYNEDGKAYLTVKGGEKQRILSSSASSMLIPARTATLFSSPDGLSYIYSVSDLRGQCYRTGSGLYYVDGKGESNKLVADYSAAFLSADGKSLIYLKNGDLVKIDNVAKGDTKDITDDAEIESFRATADLSAVYYKDEDDTLWYQKGTGKPVEVGDDPDRYFIAPDGSTCFIIADETLYTSKGKEWSKVKELSDDVTDCNIVRGICYFVQEDGDEINVYTTTAASPKVLVEGFEGSIG